MTCSHTHNSSLAQQDLRVLFGAATRLVPYTCDSPLGLRTRSLVEAIVREYHIQVAEALAGLVPIQEAKRKPSPPTGDTHLDKAIRSAGEKARVSLETVFEQALHEGANANAGKKNTPIPKDAARNWAKKQAGQMIDNITNADRMRIAKAIDDGIAKKKSTSAIAKDILSRVNDDQMTEARARMLAVTETHNALSAGAYHAARERNATGHKWVVVRDKDLCELCEANAAMGLIPIDKPFQSVWGPIQMGSAHPHCRCFELYDYAKTFKHKQETKTIAGKQYTRRTRRRAA
jgi:hypothetical protein